MNDYVLLVFCFCVSFLFYVGYCSLQNNTKNKSKKLYNRYIVRKPLYYGLQGFKFVEVDICVDFCGGYAEPDVPENYILVIEAFYKYDE